MSLPFDAFSEEVGPTTDAAATDSTTPDPTKTDTTAANSATTESTESYALESKEEVSPVEVVEQPSAGKKTTKSAKEGGYTMRSKEETLSYYPETQKPSMKKKENALPGGHIKMSGSYRLAAGYDGEDFIVNDANADLQERNWRYLFGERQNNTYDPAIYSKYLLNVDFSPVDKVSFFTQLVADPWSYVGTTGEQINRSTINPDLSVRYNLKYFGAFNSTITEVYRTHYTDSIGFPQIKMHDGHLTPGTVVHGFNDYNPATHGIPFNIPEHDLYFEFHPIRKLWADYTEDQWHARAFMFADQKQALTSDDPLEISNHKDYWQQSPWLYQYQPAQFFTSPGGGRAGGIQRGYYNDALSFYATDSEGNRLTLLRGAAFEGDSGKTYFAATVASPFTPWDDAYYNSLVSDNFMGAARLKHQATDKLMVGGTYTFRNGLINDSPADVNQVAGVDFSYDVNKHVNVKGEIAGSHNDQDLLTDDTIRTDREGYAYKLIVNNDFDHKVGHKLFDGHTKLQFSYTQMDRDFNPNLSRYTNTRDDNFWSNHLTFRQYTPDMEYFRVGDGVDINRSVFRVRWQEKIFKERFENTVDARNVHRATNGAYVETVIRDEATFRFSNSTTWKALYRWQGLPTTQAGIEPFMPDMYFIGFQDPSQVTFANVDVPADRDPSRQTYAIAVQHKFNREFTAEGFFERTNDMPSFPRGLMNGTYKDVDALIDGVYIDRVTNFLYKQAQLEAVPPYPWFNIFREKFVYKPEDRLTYTLHAAQNGYKFWGGIDDNINHVGLSTQFNWSKKLTFFADYTHSWQIDLPKFIASNYADKSYDGHDNFYVSMDYKIRPEQILKMEYGVFGFGDNAPMINPWSTTSFSLPTIDTEHLFRVSLSGDF